jgi:hypothetical protein
MDGDGTQLWKSPQTQQFVDHVEEINSKHPNCTQIDHSLCSDVLRRLKTGS